MTTEPEAVSLPGAQALLFRDAPSWEGLRCAAVGAIQFESAAQGCALLESLARDLEAEGFGGLLGPMDGDTWHRYRVVTESDGAPPFLMEPASGGHDLEAFESAGFAAVSRYLSARALLSDTLGPQAAAMPGIVVEPWDGRDAEGLIGELFAMSAAAFSGNRFFKPITKEAFLELYRPLFPMIDPRHVLFARAADGALAGFLFGMPNPPSEGQKPAAILKTYASGLRGVGHLLADSYHRRAIDMGFEEVIHALMQEDNVSRTRSDQHKARVFRRYALMGRKL